MEDLKNYSDSELEKELERRKIKLKKELERRKIKLKNIKPNLIEKPKYTNLLNLVNEYIKYLEEGGSEDNDYDHYIFERAVETFYGNGIWKYLNSL